MSFDMEIARALRRVAYNPNVNSNSTKSDCTVVKEILRDVENDVSEIPDRERKKHEKVINELWKLINNKNYYQKKILKKHWSIGCTIISQDSDDWKPLPKSELLPGEMSAAITVMGRYVVRSSKRVYEKKLINDKYTEIPANQEITQKLSVVHNHLLHRELWNAEYKDIDIYHEIYVKSSEDTDNDFIRLARAKVSESVLWYEYVSDIFLAKENILIPDEKASLIVLVSFTGSSTSSDHWYKIDSKGKISRLSLGGYSDDKWKKFEPFSGEW